MRGCSGTLSIIVTLPIVGFKGHWQKCIWGACLLLLPDDFYWLGNSNTTEFGGLQIGLAEASNPWGAERNSKSDSGMWQDEAKVACVRPPTPLAPLCQHINYKI